MYHGIIVIVFHMMLIFIVRLLNVLLYFSGLGSGRYSGVVLGELIEKKRNIDETTHA